MPWDKPKVRRLLSAVMLASAGGLLCLSNQWVRMAKAPRDQGTPASLEMMRLLRDEHDLVADMLKAQLALSGSSFDSMPIATTERPQTIAMR